MSPKATNGQLKRPGRRLLKPGETQLPARLFIDGTKSLAAARMVSAGEWIRGRRNELGLSQAEASADLNIPLRQLKTLEAIAKWPKEAREFIRVNSARLPAGEMTLKVANRRWGSKTALLAALQRIVDGRPARKRPGKADASTVRDPDILALEDRIRDRLGMRVTLESDGQSGRLEVVLSSIDDHERLIELLGC